jgi:hypothetical protein
VAVGVTEAVAEAREAGARLLVRCCCVVGIRVGVVFLLLLVVGVLAVAGELAHLSRRLDGAPRLSGRMVLEFGGILP